VLSQVSTFHWNLSMIHKALRLIRQFHQIKVSELATRFSVSKAHLVDLESGVTPVNPKLLEQYSEYFDIPVSSLIFFSESIGREGKKAKKFRLSLAGKILEIADWVTLKNEKKAKT